MQLSLADSCYQVSKVCISSSQDYHFNTASIKDTAYRSSFVSMQAPILLKLFQEARELLTSYRIAIRGESGQPVSLRFIVEGRLKYSEPRVSGSGAEIVVVLPNMEEGR